MDRIRRRSSWLTGKHEENNALDDRQAGRPPNRTRCVPSFVARPPARRPVVAADVPSKVGNEAEEEERGLLAFDDNFSAAIHPTVSPLDGDDSAFHLIVASPTVV